VGWIILKEDISGVRKEVKGSTELCWRVVNGTSVGLDWRSKTSFSRWLSLGNMGLLAV
jgi:hypothetical protein